MGLKQMNREPKMNGQRGRRLPGRDRRAVAAVEFAVVSPLVVLFVLGTIEACTMIFLKQSLKLAAYEASRVAIMNGTTLNNAIGTANQILTARGVRGGVCTVSPANFPTRPYGTNITVTVTAPCSLNAALPPWFYAGRQVTADATMMKEY